MGLAWVAISLNISFLSISFLGMVAAMVGAWLKEHGLGSARAGFGMGGYKLGGWCIYGGGESSPL